MITTINGKIVECLGKKQGVSQRTGTAWASQDYVIEEEGGDLIVFNVFGQDKIDQYGLKRGMQVSVKVSIKAQEYQGKYYTKISCMQCFAEQNNTQETQQQRSQQGAQQVQQAMSQQHIQQTQQQFNTATSNADLPF